MLPQYRFLAHEIFLEQSLAFADKNEKHPEYLKAFRTQCKKACIDPTNAGEILHGIVLPQLKGKIYKCWVGGRRKFRFVYLFHSGYKVILPVLITNELRSNINWDKLPWQEYADEIYSDLVNGNNNAFKDWTASLLIP